MFFKEFNLLPKRVSCVIWKRFRHSFKTSKYMGKWHKLEQRDIGHIAKDVVEHGLPTKYVVDLFEVSQRRSTADYEILQGDGSDTDA